MAKLAWLLKDLTGLHLYILWHDLECFPVASRVGVVCPKARWRLHAQGVLPPGCRVCLETHWARAVRAGIRGHRFLGACGFANFWGTVSVDGLVILTAVLRSRMPAGQGAPRTPRAVTPRGSGASGRDHDGHVGRAAVRAICRGAALLRLMLHDLQQTAVAMCARCELDQARRCLHRHDVEEARLRKELGRRLPGATGPPPHDGAPSRGLSVVRMMMDQLRQHYAGPIHLKGLAALFGMNAAYLSDLFSRTTGLAFHDYLHELRLSKAKALLEDPLKSVKEVASAVGYPDPNTFRQAFKSKTGLAPSVWRVCS